MRHSLIVSSLGLLLLTGAPVGAQTEEDLTKLIGRLIELDSIDLSKGVKFRAGLQPPLHAVDADETDMKVLTTPDETQGRGKPGAMGWYRVSLVVPEKIGKFAYPPGGYPLGVESNVRGSWEIYTYINGKPAGAGNGLLTAFSQEVGSLGASPGTQNCGDWMSNAAMAARPGDKLTIAILAWASPVGKGNPEGFALRHLRLRFAGAHTAARRPFYGGVPFIGGVSTPGFGSGLLGAREKLRTLKGEELKALQGKLKAPIAHLDAVFEAAETGQLSTLSKAMLETSKAINEALK